MDYSYAPGYDTCIAHPHDAGVWIGGIGALDAVPAGVDAVVTLSRYGATQVPPGIENVVFRLIDTRAEDNPNLDFVIDDAARTVARLRDEGRTVLLHCVASHSRTPTVALRYSGLRGVPLDEAQLALRAALPHASPRRCFLEALRRLETGSR